MVPNATLPATPFSAFLTRNLPKITLSETDTSVMNCFTSGGTFTMQLPSYDGRATPKRMQGNIVELLRLQACLERVGVGCVGGSRMGWGRACRGRRGCPLVQPKLP